MSDTSYSLKDSSIPKLLLSYAGPAVLGLLINALYNIVDRIFVGQFVGAEGLSAVTIAFPITLLQLGFTVLFGSGTGVLISKYLGESKPEEAEKALGNMIAGLLVTILLFTMLGLLFCRNILQIFGAQNELLKLSTNYQQIIFMGFPFAFFIAFEFTCRAEGNPRLPAYLILISSLINITLDLVFMKYLNMGIRGAALATIIAQSVNGLLLIRYYLSGKSLINVKWNNIRLQKNIIFPILSLGMAPFIMDVSSSIQNVTANHLLLQSGGTFAIAAMGIIFSMNVIFQMIALGTGDGMQPIVSFNYGANRPDRSRKTLLYAMSVVCLSGLLGLIILELFPNLIIGIFITDNEDVINVARTALRLFALSLPFYMMQIVATRYFQALHQKKTAVFLAILRPVLLFIPILYSLNWLWGLNGIWISFVVGDSLAFLITWYLIRKYRV
ncbi:MATE family efflux transporter [Saccharicrinis fermentans]|uniref:Multidrug export protein MepA n=1 Tax=Saccharicrinis fermentans DSM 9555 = JCM 21142 TaxID=869213 RepID=W7Y5F0_9BACT|nr:MATE family efflux transporter [Saccharicrinis fermentans]GAF02793.1 staphylococcal virulence regulator protein A [Saccharicrinis fermentans DSM 9555 = JCM 21142]